MKKKIISIAVVALTAIMFLSSIVFFTKTLNKGSTVEAKGDKVTANPTLTGTEDALTGLDINGTAYQIPNGGFTIISKTQTFPVSDGSTFSFTADEMTQINNNFDKTVVSIFAPIAGQGYVTTYLYPYARISTSNYNSFVSPFAFDGNTLNLTIIGANDTTATGTISLVSVKKYEHRIVSLITVDGATHQVHTVIITADKNPYSSLAGLPTSVRTRLQNGYPCIVKVSGDDDSVDSIATMYLSGSNIRVEGQIAMNSSAHDIWTSTREMITAVGIDYDTVTEI